MIPASELERLIADIREHPHADMYRNAWGEVRSFEALPSISRDTLAACPLSRRTYKKEQGTVRIVHGASRPFLCARGFSDIAAEPYGLISKRPLIYFADAHDTVEKAMWAYLNGMVPLAGEKNTAVTSFAASAYNADSIITDPISIAGLVPYLEKRSERLLSISLIGTSFRSEELDRYRIFAERIRLLLALPETGAFAEAELSDRVDFSPLAGCLIEGTDMIVLTKSARLVTPIVRFDTGLSISLISGH